MTAEITNYLGIVVGAVLTLFILSYLLGDNALYRLATHILVGVGAAYILVIVIFDVLGPRLIDPIRTQTDLASLVVAILGLLGGFFLLLKAWPRLAWLGNSSVGYLVGVGAAVTLGGALFGTLGAQVQATALPPGGFVNGVDSTVLNVIMAFGAITTLLSFGFYRASRQSILRGINAIGRFFLSVALGATFALVYVASISWLIDRIQAIANVILQAPK